MSAVLSAQNRERADARSEFERLYGEVEARLGADPGDAVERLGALSRALVAAASASRRRLQASSAASEGQARNLAAWVARQHDAIVRGAMRVLRALEQSSTAIDPRIAGLGLYHWGEAVKWSLWREPEDYVRLHAIFAAVDEPTRRVPSIPKQGAAPVTLEFLFLRALLLARFAAGALAHSQAEILDDWLQRWSQDLRAERKPTSDAVLRVDLDGSAGLCEGRRAGDGPALYLAVGPLERCRREAVRSLREGTHTGSVSAAHFEDQVALLDYLRRGLAFGIEDRTLRAQRSSEEATEITAWMGLADILRTAGIEGDAEAGSSEDSAAAALRMRLRDASATGFGLEAAADVADRLQVDELIAWKSGTNDTLTLARVVRRTTSRARGAVAFGAQLLSRTAVPLALRRLVAAAGDACERKLLFVAGDDESGRRDGFLFPSWGFELQSEYEARIAGATFRLRFNRVRMQGPGWVLAGFEMLMPGEARPSDGELDLVPLEAQAERAASNADWDDIWTREVKARLLQ